MPTLAPPIYPMLLTSADVPPEGSYVHQVKWDGHRALLVYNRVSGVRLFTRHGTRCTRQYPELQSIPVDADTLVLDGEMVVIRDGKPCFESVMTKFRTQNTTKVKRLTDEIPAHFVAFDVLERNGTDLTRLDLVKRQDVIQNVVQASNVISVCQSFEDGKALFRATKDLGLEGIVSKYAGPGSRYVPGTRSRQWLKFKHYKHATVTITALRKGQFGWLLMENGKSIGVMEFVPPIPRKALYGIVKSIVRSEDEQWIYLELVIRCKVKFQGYTRNGFMRCPSFEGFVDVS